MVELHHAWSGSSVDTPAWPGWYGKPEMENLRADWSEAPDFATQKKICSDIQQMTLQDVPFWALGQTLAPTAYRKGIRSVVDGFAVFWNVKHG